MRLPLKLDNQNEFSLRLNSRNQRSDETDAAVVLPVTAERIPLLGQGTWHMGESRRTHTREVDALRLGLDLNMTLIDTAEYYGAGGAERVVADAIAGRPRQSVFIVTKVWPSHASFEGVQTSVRGSLARLSVDYVDAVLLHWPNRSIPLADTLRAFRGLRDQGLIRYYGVSNFSTPWLQMALTPDSTHSGLVFNQMPYHLGNRRVERSVLPLCQAHHICVMAYSPLRQGRLSSLAGWPVLEQMAGDRGVSVHQVALNWVIQHPGVMAIPKAANPNHIRDNAGALTWSLTREEMMLLDAAFLAPRRDVGTGVPPYQAFYQLAYWMERLRFR